MKIGWEGLGVWLHSGERLEETLVLTLPLLFEEHVWSHLGREFYCSFSFVPFVHNSASPVLPRYWTEIGMVLQRRHFPFWNWNWTVEQYWYLPRKNWQRRVQEEGEEPVENGEKKNSSFWMILGMVCCDSDEKVHWEVGCS